MRTEKIMGEPAPRTMSTLYPWYLAHSAKGLVKGFFPDPAPVHHSQPPVHRQSTGAAPPVFTSCTLTKGAVKEHRYRVMLSPSQVCSRSHKKPV